MCDSDLFSYVLLTTTTANHFFDSPFSCSSLLLRHFSSSQCDTKDVLVVSTTFLHTTTQFHLMPPSHPLVGQTIGAILYTYKVSPTAYQWIILIIS